jgi:hypothetical protein
MNTLFFIGKSPVLLMPEKPSRDADTQKNPPAMPTHRKSGVRPYSLPATKHALQG